MNKKSMTTIEIIIWLGIAAFVGFILLNFFGRTSSEAGTLFSSETLKARDAKCKFDTERAAIKPTDLDDDGRADSCDICLSQGKESNNDKDNDLDGMPTYCDKDDNDRTIVACKSPLSITKDKRCQG